MKTLEIIKLTNKINKHLRENEIFGVSNNEKITVDNRLVCVLSKTSRKTLRVKVIGSIRISEVNIDLTHTLGIDSTIEHLVCVCGCLIAEGCEKINLN